MRIRDVRLNVVTGTSISVAPSPAGGDGDLWETTATLRNTCCVTLAVLAGTELELTVRLEAQPTPAGRIRLDGLSVSQASIFTQNVRVSIEPHEWHNGKAECRIRLNATALRALGVAWRRSAWAWQWRPAGGAASALGVSEHLVFVIAGSPTFPWSIAAAPPADAAGPWAGALALACDFGEGATSVADAASRVLARVTGLANDGWRYNSAASTYLNPGIGAPLWFLCALFIDAARGVDSTLPRHLSCFEAAAVMVSFSNLLGCELQPAKIQRNDCDDFNVNTVWPLGAPQPQTGVQFARHVVACDRAGGASSDFLGYDPVLRLDTDPNPQSAPRTWQFAAAVPIGLTTSTPGTGRLLPQLIPASGLAACVVDRMTAAQVAPPSLTQLFDLCARDARTRFLRQLPTLPDLPLARRPRSFMWSDFTPVEATQIPASPKRTDLPQIPPRTRMVYVPVDPDWPETKDALLITDFWTGDPETTQGFMAELLTMADRPPRRMDHQSWAVYASAEGTTLWVLLEGAVARITNAGARSIDLVQSLRKASPR